MNVATDSTWKTSQQPPLTAFEGQLTNLCAQDKYREMAESYLSFVKSHAGTSYLAFEPIPAKVSDHLIKKTQSPSAFITMTLRRPTWETELSKALADPAAFQTFVKSLEADVLAIAKQAKKLS
jgi:hypothetical protein